MASPSPLLSDGHAFGGRAWAGAGSGVITPDHPLRLCERGECLVQTKARPPTRGAAMTSNIAHNLSDNTEPDQKGGACILDQGEVEALVAERPGGPRKAAV